jgi:DNA-binding CsgD family transcriptional regulator
MAQGYQALTEKEKQTLRLILRGHDAKSLARHLGLSVHTVNERLRDARRKLSVTSSREAARLLLEREGRTPEMLGDKDLPEAKPASHPAEAAPLDADRKGKVSFAWGIAGGAIMSLILGLAVLTSLPAGTPSFADPAAFAPGDATSSAAATEPADAARAWLELGDRGRWEDGWRATGDAFRRLNTVAVWADTGAKVRGPLGAVRSREVLSQEEIPAPPAGLTVVKFRTDFANKPGVVETITLAREGGVWKVVGVYLD